MNVDEISDAAAPEPARLDFEIGPPPSKAYDVVDTILMVALALWGGWIGWRYFAVEPTLASCTGGRCKVLFYEYGMMALLGPGLAVGLLAGVRSGLGGGSGRYSTRVAPEWVATSALTILSLFAGKALAMLPKCGDVGAPGKCMAVASSEMSVGGIIVPALVYLILVRTIGQRRQKAGRMIPLTPAGVKAAGDMATGAAATADAAAGRPKIAPPSKGSAPLRPNIAPPSKGSAPMSPKEAFGVSAGPKNAQQEKGVPPKKAKNSGLAGKTIDGVRMIEYDEWGNLATSNNIVSVGMATAARCWVIWLIALCVAVALNFFSCRNANVLLGSLQQVGCGSAAGVSVLWFGVLVPLVGFLLLWGAVKLLELTGPVGRSLAQTIAPVEFASESVPLGLVSGIWLAICLSVAVLWSVPGLLGGAGAPPDPSARTTWRGTMGKVVDDQILEVSATMHTKAEGSSFTAVGERVDGATHVANYYGVTSGNFLTLRAFGRSGWCPEWSRGDGVIEGENLTITQTVFSCRGVTRMRFTGVREEDKVDSLLKLRR